jgi:hypothetical protein
MVDQDMPRKLIVVDGKQVYVKYRYNDWQKPWRQILDWKLEEGQKWKGVEYVQVPPPKAMPNNKEGERAEQGERAVEGDEVVEEGERAEEGDELSRPTTAVKSSANNPFNAKGSSSMINPEYEITPPPSRPETP